MVLRSVVRTLGVIVAAFLPFAIQAAQHPPISEEGERGGAKFTIVVPGKWNHRVLLRAHGYIPESRPLNVDFSPAAAAYRTLVNEGWLIAATSYRRNGIIVTDAMADLTALRQLIEERYGRPDRVILEGESMGGLIVTLLAEREPQHYSGALAIGAALDLQEPGAAITPSAVPRMPLLFMSNQNELEDPSAYAARCVQSKDDGLRPAIFRIARDGHVNVNQAERLAAIRTLHAWIESGRSSVPTLNTQAPDHDATVVPAVVPSRITTSADRRSLTSHVTTVSAAFGNVTIDAQPFDLADAGIHPGDWFELSSHGKVYRANYGSSFGSVKEGEWVIFPDADGFFCVSRNYADAAGTAGLSAGDAVMLHRLDPPTK